MPWERLEKQSLTEQATALLRRLIIEGAFAVGDRLPTEAELGERLGVGRSTVREAVRALAHEGVVVARQGSGTYVAALPEETEALTARLRRARIAEVHEARRAIETEIAVLAALRRTEDDLQAMRAALDEREVLRHTLPDNIAQFVEADLRFHNAIARASKNAVLVDLYTAFTRIIRDSLLSLNHDIATAADRERKEYQAKLHELLYASIAANDAEAARQATHELLRDIVDSLEL